MSLLLIILCLGIPMALSVPLGKALTWAMQPQEDGSALRKRIDTILHLGGVFSLKETQNWKEYCFSLVLFNGFMFLVGYGVLAFQQHLPLNPDSKGTITYDLIFHTVASFVSNTNQQHYSGEVTLSYFSQLFGLMWLQFLSAATGLAALAALARGLAGNTRMGNFYLDLLRATVLVILPLAVVVAVLLVFCGVPMTFKGALSATTLEGIVQNIARGPVAAMTAIKQLGTNGGGFFGANAAHPFENPSFFSNMIECISILLLPMASVWMFGRITGRLRHAAIIFVVMAVLLTGMTGFAVYFEGKPAEALRGLPVEKSGNLEGKELRFGAVSSPLWSAVTTASSNGSVNCMLDSVNPLTSLAPLTGMWLNIVYGGVGVGVYNIFIYIILGVFICGMMVGRTPEYMNRKVETSEMKLALLALLVHPLLILGGTSLFACTSEGISTVHNSGAHGFTEILYEFTSATANNGSGFEGLQDNTPPWNIVTGIIMLLARYIPIILPLAIAGSLARKRLTPESIGTLRIDTALFGFIIIGSILFIGALLFLPVAVLGPVSEFLATGAY